MSDQLAVLEAVARAGLREPDDGFTEGFVNDYFPDWDRFAVFFEALLERPINRDDRLPEVETFGENQGRIIRCLWWLDRIGREQAKENLQLAGLFIRILMEHAGQRNTAADQENAFLLFLELDYDYARTVYATGYHFPDNRSQGTNAHNLRHLGIPAEYARELPWEDFAGSQGYSDEDIDALYRMKVPAAYAREFHDRLLDRWGRISQDARRIIDEMAAVILFYHLGVAAGYAAVCTQLGTAPLQTIKWWQEGIAIEYIAELG